VLVPSVEDDGRDTASHPSLSFTLATAVEELMKK